MSVSKGKILAIDDEKNIRHLIESEFTFEGYAVTTTGTGEAGLNCFEKEPFDLVLLDIKLPAMNGIETLRRIKRHAPRSNVIMITGYGDVTSAVAAMKLGAKDYVTKPFKLNELLRLASEVIRESREEDGKENGGFKSPSPAAFSAIECPSPAMQKVYGLAEKIAATDSTVLIQGETGVGKDVLAAFIHSRSQRKGGPFVVVDCGLLNQNLAESELYGHKKGAFSGAGDDKPGLVEKSHKGTLFLDEIGNIDLELQKKFLRFLDTRRFRRVGETREMSVDSRIILATNMDLKNALRQGAMREDLFYRMDVMQIEIPPLRMRPLDVRSLIGHFMGIYAERYGPRKLAHAAMERLVAYKWPGNIREIKSVIHKAMIFAESEIIGIDDLPPHIPAPSKGMPKQPKTLEDVEKEHILRVLKEVGGNQTRASEMLGINRKTLYKKIHKYKILA